MSIMMPNRPYWSTGQYKLPDFQHATGNFQDVIARNKALPVRYPNADPNRIDPGHWDPSKRQPAGVGGPASVSGANWLAQPGPVLRQGAPPAHANVGNSMINTHTAENFIKPPSPAPQLAPQVAPPAPAAPAVVPPVPQSQPDFRGMIGGLGGLFGEIFGQRQMPSFDRSLFGPAPQMNQPMLTHNNNGWQRPMYPQQPPAAMPMQPTGTNPLIGRYG
jgi:hypothetical protein